MKKGNKPDEIKAETLTVKYDDVTKEELKGKKETKKPQPFSVIKQTVHRFGIFESPKSVDKKLNTFLQEKFKEGKRPMISTYIKGIFGIRYIITLHTETIEI